MKKPLKSRLLRTLFPVFCVLAIASPAPASDDGVENLRRVGKTFAAVARAVSPSVVFIQARTGSPGTATNPSTAPSAVDLLRHLFGDASSGDARSGRRNPGIGQGSGFVFAAADAASSPKTYVLTTHAVIGTGQGMRVKFHDGREYDARLTGRDPESDLAVIEVQTAGPPPLPVGDLTGLHPGAWVVALGNPYGHGHTLTVGVVSAKGSVPVDRDDYRDFIHTDARINAGNAGGPLVNLEGEVVGINTILFGRSGGHGDLGLAIPIDFAMAIARRLIEEGEVIRGSLGILPQALTPAVVVSRDKERSQGIGVAQVPRDSAAAAAGLRAGDVIVAYGGEPVTGVGDFRNRVALTRPGSRESLTVIRDGERVRLTATVAKLSREQPVSREKPVSREQPVEQSLTPVTDSLGLIVQTLTPKLAERYNAKAGEGVLVGEVTPASMAATAGFETGYVILEVDGKPVRSAARFERMVKDSRSDGQVLLLVRKGETDEAVTLSW